MKDDTQKGSTMDFSLIVPCYNEAENIHLFFGAACRCFENADHTCEFVFIDDGSTDGTIDVIRQQIKDYRDNGGAKLSFTVIEFSRNFGKEAALYAGLQNATGNYIGFIDADMQQDPEVALSMLEMLIDEPEYDCIAAVQNMRREGLFIRVAKESFYKLFNHMSDTHLLADVSDFRVFTRQVADAILSMPEHFRFSKGLFSWIGFRTKVIPYEVHERHAGKTKWSFKKLVSYAWNGVLAFSTLPLKIIMFIGSLLAIIALALLVIDVVQKFVFNDPISLTMMLMYVVVLFSGIQMVVLGVIGEYMARGYLETKHRPIYIARSTTTDRAEGVQGVPCGYDDITQRSGFGVSRPGMRVSQVRVVPLPKQPAAKESSSKTASADSQH